MQFQVPGPANMPNGEFCTLSALDQRDWGGCIDFQITPKAGVAPHVPAANLDGKYTFGADHCVRDSDGCCCLTGELVLTHQAAAQTARGSVTINANAACSPPLERTTATFTLSSTTTPVEALTANVDIGTFKYDVVARAGGAITLTNSMATGYCSLSYMPTTPKKFVDAPADFKTAAAQALGLTPTAGTDVALPPQESNNAMLTAAVAMSVVGLVMLVGLIVGLRMKLATRLPAYGEDSFDKAFAALGLVFFVCSIILCASPSWTVVKGRNGQQLALVGPWRVCPTGFDCGDSLDSSFAHPSLDAGVIKACRAFVILGVFSSATSFGAAVLKVVQKDVGPLDRGVQSYMIVGGQVLLCLFSWFALVFWGGYTNKNLGMYGSTTSPGWGALIGIVMFFLSLFCSVFSVHNKAAATPKSVTV